MRLSAAALATVALGLSLPLPAALADVESLYAEYRQTGQIQGCGHTRDELLNALDDIPADIAAYDPGFADALGDALAQRAGGCGAVPPSQGALLFVGGDATATDGSPGPVPAFVGELPAASAAAPGRATPILLIGTAALAALLSLAVVVGKFPRPENRGRRDR